MVNKPKLEDRRNHPETDNRARRLLARASSREALPYLAIGLVLMIGIVAGGREVEHHLSEIEDWITMLGPWGVLAFIGLFIIVTSFLVPETVLSIIAGAIFGLGWGFAAVLSGNLVAAAIQFGLSRKLLRRRIERTLSSRPSLAAIQRAVKGDEFRLQVLLRLTPLNPASVNYLLGAAGVRFSGFLVACLALSPHLLLEVYFGHAGKHAARLAGSEGRTAHLHDLAFFGGLAVAVAVVFFVSRMARKTIIQAVAEKDAESEEPDIHQKTGEHNG